MFGEVAFIGFGEAGQAFAAGASPRAFDIDSSRTTRATLAETLAEADAVISVVTADQALAAAKSAAQYIRKGSYYFDLNSVAPQTKQEAAKAIESAGGHYIDVAVMAPVHPKRLETPLLVCGTHAAAGLELLTAYGFKNVRVVGNDIGRASTVKMLRSVMYKGVEALTLECLLACEKAGVTDEVLASFGNDWSSGADYRLDRMLVHGLRRSAEMRESARTLSMLEVSPKLTEGTVAWQQALGELNISPVPEGLRAKLTSILEKLP